MRILIVDDERRMTEALSSFLSMEGIEAQTAKDGFSAQKRLEEEAFDAVVTDLRMPGLDGMGLLKWIKGSGPFLPVIVISAHGEVRDAVEAMRLGAYDYLVKPFDPEELSIRLRKAISERRSLGLLEAGARRYGEGTRLIGESPAIKEAVRLIERAAPSSATMLLTGESGTGKEVAARLVHELSGREGAFVAVNVGAVPETLLESELFGHEKGAFTGADMRRLGLFETAQRGTLFLDEIGELPIHLQVKLLRVVQEKKISRLGSSAALPVDVRLVAATNRDLEEEVRAGRFREDLYYRINVIRVRLPPLRDREGDRSLLAGYFLKKISAELGRKIEGLTPEALGLLDAYPFPGNVRELENALERAVILAEGPILEARDFQFSALRQSGSPELAQEKGPRRLADIEKEAIAEALTRNRFHRERSAVELGITRRTLLNKIKEYALPIPNRDED